MDFVLIPIISEKSMQDAGIGKFTFKSPTFVNKGEAKKTIEKRFEVNVIDISTTTVKGKTMRVGERRSEVKKSPWKKITVRLKEGQKIGLFELGEKK